MLSGNFKLRLFFLFATLLWQSSTVDTSPTSAINEVVATSKDDVFHLLADNNHRDVPIIKNSLQLTVDEQLPNGNSRFRSHPRYRRLGKKLHSMKLKNSPNAFQSTGTYHKKFRVSQRVRPPIDDRLKRFRMLDPDEFKEMLNIMSQQMPQEQPKGFNNMDAIGGIQVENYWSRK